MIQEYDPMKSPYSFGTTPIYNTLFKLISAPKDETDVVCINLSAIVRNVASKTNLVDEYKDAKEKAFPFNVVAQDIAKSTISEVQLLVNDIVQMYNLKEHALPRYVYVYMGAMQQIIPKEYYRESAPGKIHIDMAESILREKYKNSRTEANLNGINVIEIYTVGKVSVFRLLEKELRHLRNQHNVIMVTNHPTDYHLFRYVGQWCNVKSFTGEIQKKDDLGKKVFDKEFLPFTERLHILLGDKTDIKPCIESKAKKKLLEIAEKDHWNLKSNDYTDRELNRLNLITPYII